MAGGGGRHTTSGTDLDVQGGDAELLAAGGDVLGRQHGGVGGGLVTVGLDLHTTGDTADGFAATGITQDVSLFVLFFACARGLIAPLYINRRFPSRADEPEIGDVDEGVVEGGEDTGDAENEFTCEEGSG